jgi:hypothetical protein
MSCHVSPFSLGLTSYARIRCSARRIGRCSLERLSASFLPFRFLRQQDNPTEQTYLVTIGLRVFSGPAMRQHPRRCSPVLFAGIHNDLDERLAAVGRLLECNTKASTGDALPFLSDNTAWGSLPSRRWPFSAFSTGLLAKWASVTRTSASSATTPT